MEGGVGWWRQITDALDVVQFLVLVMTPAALRSEIAQREWLYARHRGVCVYPVLAGEGPPDFKALPGWMRKVHFFDLTREWDTFVNYLKSPCRVRRVPFMAPELPPNYVSRDALLERVVPAVLKPSRKRLALTTALLGAGGLGKTTLAAALCHRSEVVSTYDDGILWVTLGKSPNLVEVLGRIYTALTGRPSAFIDKDDGEYQVSGLLEDRSCLLVIDDVWDPAHLRPFLRGGPNCFRLITTRVFEVADDAERLDIDEMTVSEAVQLVSAHLDHRRAHLREFHRLAHRLGEWPLLLELANAALRHRVGRGDTIEGAIQYLGKKLDKQGVVAFDARNATERQQAIVRTLDLSLELLGPQERDRCIELSVFPEDTDVPVEAVRAMWSVDEFDAEELLQAIDNTSLIRFDVRTGAIRIHDVVRAYLETKAPDLRRLHAQLAQSLATAPDAYSWKWRIYHLVQAGQRDVARQLLLSFSWMQGKHAATDLSDLIREYQWFAEDEALADVAETLKLASPVLLRNPSQLAAQILGRLSLTDGRAPLRELAEGARALEIGPWLEPLSPVLTPPGGALRMTLSGHAGPVLDLLPIDEGAGVVSAGADGTVRVWDLLLGRSTRTFTGHRDWVRRVVSVDRTRVLSASDDGTLRVWDLMSGLELAVIPVPGEEIVDVTVDADGTHASTRTPEGTKRWNLKTGELVEEITARCDRATSTMRVGTRRVAIGGEDGTLTISERETGTRVAQLEGHTAAVNALALLDDDRVVLSASDDGTLRMWAPDRPMNLRPPANHAGPVRAVCFAPDGDSLCSTSDFREMKQWDASHASALDTFNGRGIWTSSAGKPFVAWGSPLTGLHCWPAGEEDGTGKVVRGREGLRGVEVRSGSSLLLWDQSSGLSGWDLENRSSRFRVSNLGESVTRIAIATDASAVAIGGLDGVIRIWSRRTSWITIRADSRAATSGLAVACGAAAVAAVQNGRVSVWELDRAGEAPQISDIDTQVGAVAFAPNGHFLATAASSLSVWDLTARRRVAEYTSEAEMLACAWHPGGNALAAGDALGYVHVLRLRGVR